VEGKERFGEEWWWVNPLYISHVRLSHSSYMTALYTARDFLRFPSMIRHPLCPNMSGVMIKTGFVAEGCCGIRNCFRA
jgi:hypothetical protein